MTNAEKFEFMKANAASMEEFNRANEFFNKMGKRLHVLLRYEGVVLPNAPWESLTEESRYLFGMIVTLWFDSMRKERLAEEGVTEVSNEWMERNSDSLSNSTRAFVEAQTMLGRAEGLLMGVQAASAPTRSLAAMPKA